MNIARLESVPLRELWPNEALNFTTWLSENLDFLGDALGLELSLVEREAAAGTFSADILAEDENSNPVIIENQLERTDHDHLGKLITYLSNLDAKTAIWVTPEPRLEHEQAVHWLNEVLPADTAFYLVKLEAYRIGDSPAAPLLTVVAGPSPEARQVGKAKKQLAERHILRREFWAQLLERAKKKTSLHAQISPSKENWISTGAGKSGVSYNYVILMEAARIELYIASSDAEENKHIFDALYAHRDKADEVFGKPLEWLRQDNIKASRICYVIPGGGLRDQDCWPEIQDRMIDAMVLLEKALKPHIKRLPA